jgi:hypothetical protein
MSLVAKTLGITPDADISTPSVLSGLNILPTKRGMKGSPSPVGVGVDALPEPALSAATVTLLNGETRTLVGTSVGLYELTATTWDNVGTYTSAGAWSFTQFGNTTLAANGIDKVQASAGVGGAFANISSSPISSIVEVSGGFALAFHEDGWACSALYDHTDWTPNITTQAANGRLLDTSGAITAAKRQSSGVVVYKAKSMYYGQYVGGDVIWSWSTLNSAVGCVGKDAIIDANGVHFFVGEDDIYSYDGSSPRSISGAIREWFFGAELNVNYAYKIQAAYDRINNLVWFWYPSNASSDGTLNKAIVYNLYTSQWGVVAQSAQAVLNLIDRGVTLDELGKWTFDTLPAVEMSSPFWLGGNRGTVAIVGMDSALATMTGASSAANLTVGDFGDITQFTTIKRLTPLFSTNPTACEGLHQHKQSLGGELINGATQPWLNEKIDMLFSSRWHRFTLILEGDFEILSLHCDYTASGAR